MAPPPTLDTALDRRAEDRLRDMTEDIQTLRASLPRAIDDRVSEEAGRLQKNTARLVDAKVEEEMARVNAQVSRMVESQLEGHLEQHAAKASRMANDPEQLKELLKESEETIRDDLTTNFLPNKLEHLVRNHMSGLQSQLTAQVHSQLQAQLPTQIRSTLQATLPQHIQSHIDTTLPKQVKSQVYSQVQSQMSTLPAQDPMASHAAQEAELQNLLQKELSSQLPALVSSQVFEVLQQQMPTYQEQQNDTLHADVDKHLREALPNHVANQVRQYLQSHLGTQVGQQLRTSLPNTVQTQLQNQLPSQLRGLLQTQLGSQVKNAVGAELSQTLQRVADVEASVCSIRTESQRNPNEEMKMQVSQIEERLKGVEMTSMWPAPPPPSHLNEQDRQTMAELSKKMEALEQQTQQATSCYDMPVSGASVVDENIRNEVGDLQSRLAIMESGPTVNDMERKLNRRIDDLLDQKSRAGALSSKLENMEANAHMSQMKRRLDTMEQNTSRMADVLQQSKQLSARVDNLEHTPVIEDLKRRVDELLDMRGTVLSMAGRIDGCEEMTAPHRLEKEIARQVQDICHPYNLKVEGLDRAVAEMDRRLTARLDHAAGGMSTQAVSARLDSLDAHLANTYQMQKKMEDLERRTLKSEALDAEFDSRFAPRMKKFEDQMVSRLSQVEDIAQSHAPKVSLFESQFPKFSATEEATNQRLQRLEQAMSETMPALSRSEDVVEKRVSQLETRALKRLDEIEEIVPHVRQLMTTSSMAKDAEARVLRRVTELEEMAPLVRQLTASQAAQKDVAKVADDLVKSRLRDFEQDMVSRYDQMESQVLPKIRNAEANLTSRIMGQEERIGGRVSALEEHVGRSNPFESQMLSKAVDDVVPKVHHLEATLSQLERNVPPREKITGLEHRLRDLEEQTSRLTTHDDMRQKHLSQVDKERDGDRERISRVEGVEAKFGPLLTTLEQQILPWVASVEEHVIPRIKTLEDHALDTRMRAVEEDILPRLKEIEEHFPALLKVLPRVKTVEKTASALNTQLASQASQRDELRSAIEDMGVDRKVKLVEEALYPLVQVVENQIIPRVAAMEKGIGGDLQGAVARTQELSAAIQRLQQGLVTVAAQQEKTKEDCGLVCSALRDEITSLKKKQQALQQQQAAHQPAPLNQLADAQGGYAAGRISPLRPRNN
eukprot:TRINITY_DN30542_c0_g1_i1.p1 TRINITY_DN30542_c0_g1~~TRINITY_DN30542_c0_g1_i1.p1  ORF type:complete len:1371 (+),score=546.61 TRINITY_DN30542_c0_g1_i1:589-4113(+)